jgi:hypothetical protein
MLIRKPFAFHFVKDLIKMHYEKLKIMICENYIFTK